MSRPHLEDWTADGERVELCENQPPYGSVVVKMIAQFTCHAPDDCTEGERARLAAAAPSMARLLLRLMADEDCRILQPGGKAACDFEDDMRTVLRDAGVIE